MKNLLAKAHKLYPESEYMRTQWIVYTILLKLKKETI
jgi:hypothetical protein